MFGHHNWMATANRVVVVFVKEFQWDQKHKPFQIGYSYHLPKIIWYVN